MILVIDNYDSFVHNLARYFRELDQDVTIYRNDVLTVSDAMAMGADAIVVSPGPCTPAEAGISTALAAEAIRTRTPFLGVCLGHQCLVTACGGTISRAARPVHGQASPITHAGTGLFQSLPDPLTVGRYHSLIAGGTLPRPLAATAQLANDPATIMAVEHREAPAYGVQFHPESVLTDHGHALLENFLTLSARHQAGRKGAAA
ncbi:glutamine amidotransferase-related protein [Pyruvatibacter mobilis]|uniref:anthranilate synthase component II n=1 Tax=Pyruvatibacter mobilis TaxID=1712261 RepID=UPI00042A60A5